MKQLIIAALLLITFSTNAQVGIGTTTPDPSAQLDVSSTTKGFLPPRMTIVQRNAIVNPAEGLIVYLNDRKIITFYNGFQWVNFNGTPSSITLAVGDFYQGGTIGYILAPSDPGYDASTPHGLVVSYLDQSVSIQWDDHGTNIGVGTQRTLGTGLTNTSNIITTQGAGNYAAQICGDLVLNGYTNWYLPSTEELQKIYPNRLLIGGFSPTGYWTSSDVGFTNTADILDFSTGLVSNDYKYNFHRVRAIHSF